MTPDNLTPSANSITPRTTYTAADVVDAVSEQAFADFHSLTEKQRNKQDGYDEQRNNPAYMPADADHSPSRLLGCHRRIYYSAHNAPAEDGNPHGIFKFGNDFETHAEQFLRDRFANTPLTVDNTIQIDYTHNGVHVTGSTDPVVFGPNGNPLALFEVKTTGNVYYPKHNGVKQDKPQHYAQAHAYAKGLEHQYDLDSPPRIVFLYADRNDLETAFIDYEFDTGFWTDHVMPWMRENTAYRQRDDLPPALDEDDDRYGYMCREYCDYKERCGNYTPSTPSPAGDEYVEDIDSYWKQNDIATEVQDTITDADIKGFLPLKRYPESTVVAHLASYDDVVLTPTIAHDHPAFVAGTDTTPRETVEAMYGVTPEREVADWICDRCLTMTEYDTVDWDGDLHNLPDCPACPNNNAFLRGPLPSELVLY